MTGATNWSDRNANFDFVSKKIENKKATTINLRQTKKQQLTTWTTGGIWQLQVKKV